VGTLAEEFAAMPRSRGRASKRAKTEKGAKATAPAPSDSNAAHEAASGGGGVHPSSKISEVRPIPYCLRVHTHTHTHTHRHTQLSLRFTSGWCTPTSPYLAPQRIGGWLLSRAYFFSFFLIFLSSCSPLFFL